VLILNLTPAEQNNLLLFLNRVRLRGNEAACLAILQSKVQNAAKVVTPNITTASITEAKPE